MAKEKKKYWIIAGLLLFTGYFFAAPRPIPPEMVLKPRWLNSLDSNYPVFIGENNPAAAPEDEQPAAAPEGPLIPFTLGDRFGYVDFQGRFAMNRVKAGHTSLSEDYWCEYGAEPELLEIHNSLNGETISVKNGRGYPLFLNGRIFLIGSEGNSLSALDGDGTIRWTYDFAAPLTCAAAAAGVILTGSLDGVVEVLDDHGRQLFSFEPGGSRLSVILGCAISRDGSRLGIISGIDDQRFLLLERFGGSSGGEYKVVYHQFLEEGFRREVFISFIDHDSWIVFEREGGLGVYKISARKSSRISLDGPLSAIDGSGGAGLLFIISSPAEGQKKLAALRLPDQTVMEAPFKSETVFLGRAGSLLFTGGDKTLASFELEKR
ncbi:MAG: WD40 repeat domain-containing protein [Treponema sp.]|nr:WD40 repeat domain-containing protein [Treponema sp.]